MYHQDVLLHANATLCLHPCLFALLRFLCCQQLIETFTASLCNAASLEQVLKDVYCIVPCMSCLQVLTDTACMQGSSDRSQLQIFTRTSD